MKKIIIFFILILSFLNLKVYGYYYYNDFSVPSTVSNDFDLGFRYGRGGVITNCTTASSITISGGRLIFDGRVNNFDVNYIGTWVGRMAKFTDKQFSASEYKPFGVVIVRKNTRFDPHNDTSNSESWRHLDAMSFWMFVDTGLNNSSPEGSSYNDFIMMYDMMRDVFNLAAPADDQSKPFSTWGKYVSSESRFDLSSVTRANEQTSINIVNDTNYTLEWCYEDSYGNGTYAGTPNTRSTNTNTIALMMTHNGSEVKFYINPNYNSDAANPYPNEFLLAGNSSVGWSSNISFMFGQEAKRYDTEMEYFQIDSVLIRSVASNSIAEISPNEVGTNKAIDFVMYITNTFTANDSGIGEVEIEKPSGYSQWDISNFHIFTYYGTGSASTNFTSLKELSKITTGTLAGNGEAIITTNGNDLKIRFNVGTPAFSGSNVITYDTSDKRIEIHFTLTSPSAPKPTGDEFVTYVNCKKYNGSQYSRYATTGKQRVYSGNAVSSKNSTSLNVKVYSEPTAAASLTPNTIYEGTANTFYYYLSTSATNKGAYITKLEIDIPSGFGITSDNVSSLRINNDTAYVYVTNNKIVVDYDGDGNIFPSQSGLDRITIAATTTPNISQETNIKWTSRVYSSVVGTTFTYTTTNDSYKSQNLLVRLEPPDAIAYISPQQIYNNTKYNVFQYIVKNEGNPGNNINKIKIILSDVFTNANAFSSSIANSSSFTSSFGATNYIIVDYSKSGTNLPAGIEDTISFNLYDSIPSLSSPTQYTFISYSDNGNGDGFLLNTEHTYTWDVDVISPDPVGNGAILKITNGASSTNQKSFYTSDITNIFQYKIQNGDLGDSENNIKIAKISIPAVFTQIYDVTSTKIINDAVDIKITNNTIVLYYTNTNNGNLLPGQIDKVNFKVKDSITAPNSYTFDLSVANGKNSYQFFNTGNIGVENKILTVVYPPLIAEAFVKVDGTSDNIIDSSTITNSLTYYVTNYGDFGNDIKSISIYFPTNGSISECIDINSSIVTNSLNERWVSSGKYIFIDYQNEGKRLYGKTNDVITFKMLDNVTVNTSFKILIEAQNDLETGFLPCITGETQYVFIQIPPAYGKGSIYPESIFVANTGSKVTNNLYYIVKNYGFGSNKFNRVRIKIPTVFANKVQNVLSSHLTNESVSVTVDSSYISINYTNENNPLPAQTVETLKFELVNEVTNQGEYGWPLEVDNGDGNGFVSASVVSGGTTNLKVIRKAIAAISKVYNVYPAEVDVYSSVTTSTLYYKITHSGGSADIRRAKIFISYPFITNNINVNPNYSGTVAASYSVSNISGSNFILVDYPAGDLVSGEENIMEIVIEDNWTTGKTNCNWLSWVDFNDGNGFNLNMVETNTTVTVGFTFPPIDAGGYFYPNYVMMDKTKETYNIIITNYDPVGNKIEVVKVELPSQLTNITSYSSVILGTNINYDKNTGILWLKYYDYSTNIIQGKKDIIVFKGYDSAVSEESNKFKIYASNSTNTNTLVSVNLISGKSFSLNFYYPGYKSSVYITPNNMDTTITTNDFIYYIINTGSGTNNITKVKIYIQTNIYSTNNIYVTSSYKADISLQTNFILINYAASNTNILAGYNDVINIKVLDKVAYGDTSSIWNSKILYNTSFLNYKTPDVLTGASVSVNYTMPYPDAVVKSFQPQELPSTIQNFTLSFSITNKDDGSNDIFGIKISIPSYFTNNLSIGDVSSALAYNKSYSAGVIKLYYTNFTASKVDSINISLSNNSAPASNLAVSCIVSNYSHITNIEENIKVVTPPSVYVTPNNVNAVVASNKYYFYILNNGTASSNIKHARIYFPSILTNISSVTSTIISSISVNYVSNYIDLNYTNEGKSIAQGSFDTIELTGFDSLNRGYSNVSWRCDVYLCADSFVETVVEYGKSLDIQFSMPEISAKSYIVPNNIYTTDNTNDFILKVDNQGEYNNDILKLRINVPAYFSNIKNITNNVSGSSASYVKSSNFINVQYNGLFKGGLSDEIKFTGFNNNSFITQLIFSVYGYNGNTNGYIGLPAPADKSLVVETRYPPNSIETYIVNSTIYTINTNDTIEYKIRNLSTSESVKRVFISFDTNLLHINNITSTWLGTNINNSLSLKQNQIELIYTNNLLTAQQKDIISLVCSYHITKTTNLNMESMITIGTETNVGVVPGRESIVLKISKAPWGIVKGNVYPLYKFINVKILERNRDVVINDADNNELSTSYNADTGFYELTKVLSGDYRLYFESPDLKSHEYNFTMSSNLILSMPDISLHNKPMSADSSDKQTAMSYSDYKSYLQLLPGSFEKDFSADIYVEFMTNDRQIKDFESNPYIKTVSHNGVYVYRFELLDINNQSLDGVALLNDGLLKLYYIASMLNTTKWNEKNLGVYYFKESTGKWVPLGGVVDTAEKNVTAHLNYVSRFFGVFEKSDYNSKGKLKNIVVSTRVFTPGRGGDDFNMVKISFTLEEAVDKYTVSIFDLRGNLIKKIERSGVYKQGSVYWDGKDEDGIVVKSGVYIYRIAAAGESYKGTVLVVK